MPKNKVADLITDQEIAFARLVLSGTMTDRQAAETAGLNPETAASSPYTSFVPDTRVPFSIDQTRFGYTNRFRGRRCPLERAAGV
jgi:hypothetical protein